MDEQFAFSNKTPVFDNLNRVLAAIEARFSGLEAQRADFDAAIAELLSVGLTTINATLGPATQKIIKLTTLGFLICESTSTMVLSTTGIKTVVVTAGDQRDLFSPTAFVAVQRKANYTDWGFAQVLGFDRLTGALDLQFLSVYGDPGPHGDWVISDAPAISDATKYYFDQTVVARDATYTARDAALAAQAAAEDAAEVAEAAAGVDVSVLVRRDGSTPFTAIQFGQTPTTGANDTSLPTTAWTRGRISEAITSIIQGAPSQLDALSELASALANDPNFAGTMATALGNRLRVDTPSQALTSAQQQNAQQNIGMMTHGQCRLDVVGGFSGSVKLSRYNGKYIFINGRMEVIPSAGVFLTPAGLPSSNLYHIYVAMAPVGGSSIMTLYAYPQAPIQDAQFGHYTYNGNSALTFVGIAYVFADGTFADNANDIRGCASWFNQQQKVASTTLLNTTTTASSRAYFSTARLYLCRFASTPAQFSLIGEGQVAGASGAPFGGIDIADFNDAGRSVVGGGYTFVYQGVGVPVPFYVGSYDPEGLNVNKFMIIAPMAFVSDPAATFAVVNGKMSALYWG